MEEMALLKGKALQTKNPFLSLTPLYRGYTLESNTTLKVKDRQAVTVRVSDYMQELATNPGTASATMVTMG